MNYVLMLLCSVLSTSIISAEIQKKPSLLDLSNEIHSSIYLSHDQYAIHYDPEIIQASLILWHLKFKKNIHSNFTSIGNTKIIDSSVVRKSIRKTSKKNYKIIAEYGVSNLDNNPMQIIKHNIAQDFIPLE